MTLSTWKRVVVAMMTAIVLMAGGSAAQAQTADGSKWSVDFGIGWDNGLSGQVNSSGYGTLNNQVVVIMNNTYSDVYGTGLHLRFGGGYMLNDNTEVKGTFTFQSLDADFIVPMGDYGSSNLYGQYTDYQTFGLDVGLRRYGRITDKLQGYGEALIGIGFVDKIDVTLIAPGAGLAGKANDFYDQTAAFAFAINVGMLVQTSQKLGWFGQLGVRFQTGLDEIDGLVATGLDNINDKSSRWSLPIVGGIRYPF